MGITSEATVPVNGDRQPSNHRWFMWWPGIQRYDVLRVAQNAANMTNQDQDIYAPHDPNNPESKPTLLFSGRWWFLESVIRPDPVRQRAGRAEDWEPGSSK